MDSRDTKGLSPAALRATQGECSATSPKAFSNSASFMALTCFKRFHCCVYPGAQFRPFFGHHARLVAKRHGLVLHRLGFNLLRITLQLVQCFQRNALGRLLDRGIARRLRMAGTAARLDDRQRLFIR